MGLSCAIHDVVVGAFCLFMVEVEPKVLYMNYCYDIIGGDKYNNICE